MTFCNGRRSDTRVQRVSPSGTLKEDYDCAASCVQDEEESEKSEHTATWKLSAQQGAW